MDDDDDDNVPLFYPRCIPLTLTLTRLYDHQKEALPYSVVYTGSVSNRIHFSGVITGDLRPTTHQPYEADRVEPRPSMSPPPTSTDRPNPTEKGSSHARAFTNNVGIDGPTSKHQIGIDDAGRQADRWRHYGDPGRGHESEQPTQPALMGAFIDKPFGTGRRPALAELPFPCKETSQASTGWSAPAEESSVGWGPQSDERGGFILPNCRNGSDGWDSGKGSGTSPLSNFGQKYLFRETRLSSSAGVLGTRPFKGIDRMSSVSRYFLDNSLRSESWVETPAVCDQAVGTDSTGDIAERSTESLSSGHASGLLGGSSEAWKGWWGGARPSSGGEDVEAGKPADAQRVELLPYGRHRPDSSSDRSVSGLRTPEATPLREGDSVSGDVGDKESNVDGVNSVSYGEVRLTDYVPSKV